MDAFAISQEEFWLDSTSYLMKMGRSQSLITVPSASVVFETSGTTGKPRNIVLSKKGLLHSAFHVNQHLEVNPSSVWGLCLPTWHVGGFAVPSRCYVAACRLAVYDERWDAGRAVCWLEREAVTHVSLVPTQIFDIVRGKLRAPESLGAVVVGGGQLAECVGQEARDLGWPVLASYGMTEAGSQIATQRLYEIREAYRTDRLSILPCWEVRTNAESLLEIRGDALFLGELVQEITGESVFRPRESEWFATSDRVEIDCHELTILGRADALVKVLGELVSPQQITQTLTSLGMISGTFAVIALPDARKENRLVLVQDADQCHDVGPMIESYHQSAPGFQRIDEVRVVHDMPRSALGKILLNELRDRIS
jgi:O-succinylbenzoic acid--CoA ligase